MLLDPAGNDPVTVDALRFGDDGIGLVGRQGLPPRVLPWSKVSAHVVEPWAGGTVPHRPSPAAPAHHARDPDGRDGDDRPSAASPPHRPRGGGPDALPGRRPLSYVEAGALIGIHTPSGTFRFLLPKADPTALAEHLDALALRHRGPGGASSVTTALGAPEPVGGSTIWGHLRPFVVLVVVVVVVAAVALILLQSAGVIHLPLLGGRGGGSGAGTIAPWLRLRS